MSGNKSAGAVCVITGAASGIGRAIALRFGRAGWQVVAVDIAGDGLRSLTEEWPSDSRVIPVMGDVAEMSVLEHARAAASDLGMLSCWVNNAGFNIVGNVHELTVDAYQRGVAVNFDAMFWGTSLAVKEFLRTETRGNVINISSVTGLRGFGGFAAYAMCKGGILALTREVAAEYLGQGIRCNAIAPGVIDTPINQKLVQDSSDGAEEARKLKARTPMGRPGKPEEVAEAALFLANEETAGYITGTTFVVDGGLTIAGLGR